jgi:uncharacterized membrane protein
MEGFVTWWFAHVMLPKWASVFLVSMIPLVEERGGLILAKLLQMPMWEEYSGVYWGNIIPIPFILIGIKKFLHFLSDHHFSKLAEWVEAKAVKNKPKN